MIHFNDKHTRHLFSKAMSSLEGKEQVMFIREIKNKEKTITQEDVTRAVREVALF